MYHPNLKLHLAYSAKTDSTYRGLTVVSKQRQGEPNGKVSGAQSRPSSLFAATLVNAFGLG